MIRLMGLLFEIVKLLLLLPLLILGLVADKLKIKSVGMHWFILIIFYPILLFVELILVKYIALFSFIGIVWVFYMFAQYVIAPVAIVLMIPVIIIAFVVFGVLVMLLGEFAK